MKRKNATRSALFTSVISMLLCISMLVGTTFAWFTDSVTSANNVIKSGNLDIELEYWTGTEWADVEGKSDILTNKLWEPGVTEIAYLRVANAGSLALKYQLGINIVSETLGKTKDNKDIKLSDHIQFGVVEGVNGETGAYANREAAVAALTNAQPLSSGYTKPGTMAPEGELYLALVVYMPTTVGNEANHNGVNAPEINLGISVFATQQMSEDDSFGPTYDGGAPWVEMADINWYVDDPDAETFTISSAEELAGLAAIVNGTAVAPVTTYAAGEATTVKDDFAGKTIVLDSNIDLAGKNWVPIGNWDNAFQGTFNGQGHTISNLCINAPKGEGVGLFGVAVKATIKGINIRNVKIAGYSMVAGIVGAAYPANISDCKITGDVEIVAEWAYVAGVAGYCYYGTQVDGCSVIAEDTGLIQSNTRNAVGGITAWLLEGNHKVTNCHVNNLDLIGWTNVGGITGFVHYNNTIEGCSVEDVEITKTRVDGNPGIGLIAGGWNYSASNAITLRNNTVKNATLEGTHIPYSAYNVLYGSEYGGATNSNFVLENNITENITNNLIVVTEVDSVDRLKAALTTSGKYFLKNDLELTETITVPAGVEVVLYMNGKTISGTFDGTGNKEMFLVKGNMTVKGGSIDMTATQNQGWDAMATIFNVTAGGVLKLEEVTAAVSGTDMNFIVHLNNWGEVTLNVDKCDFTVPYVAVRAFNSGPDMNNVTIKNTAVHGGRLFWVHNYTSADMGGKVYSNAAAAYDEAAVAARLNIKLENNTSDNAKPIRIGMNGATYYDLEGNQLVSTAAELQAAINNKAAVVYLADGEYALSFTNQTGFNVDGMTIIGKGNNVNLSISSSEAWYGRIQGENVTFENITFSTNCKGNGVGATGKATYNNCTFNGWAICAASGGKETYFNNCVIDGCLNTSSDFDAGNVYVKNSTVAKAEYSFRSAASVMNFENCEIGELISWNANTVLTNCTVKTLDDSHMTTGKITTK